MYTHPWNQIVVKIKRTLLQAAKKECQKQEQHEKLVVVGNLNAKTSLTLKRCC